MRPLLTMSEEELGLCLSNETYAANKAMSLLLELDAQRAETPREPVETLTLYEKRPDIAFVLAEMKYRALEGCTGEHDGTCCVPDMNLHPEDWCDRCLMGTIAQVGDDLMADAARVRQEAIDQCIAIVAASSIHGHSVVEPVIQGAIKKMQALR